MMSTIGVHKNDGFTLIEVMIAVAILSLSTIVIFQSNMMNLNVYGRFTNKMAIQNWAEEKLWEAKEEILSSETPETGERSGVYEIENRVYKWRLAVSEESDEKVYTVSLRVSWDDAGQERSIERFSYVSKLGSE